MQFLLLVIAAASSYFVEWIPNNATSSPGEFPWQL